MDERAGGSFGRGGLGFLVHGDAAVGMLDGGFRFYGGAIGSLCSLGRGFNGAVAGKKGRRESEGTGEDAATEDGGGSHGRLL